ncbi:MAG: glycosyltransferase family 4 protein, partial [Candidatus Nanohaloarchaea archaeon]|nr:glycosyltransferase family 4 protein [Candidatus Nanohaloarchaea archaeon]
HLHEVPYVDLGLDRLNFIQFEKRMIARWPLLENMDVVHSHGVFPVAKYSFVADTPIVVTTHGLEEYRLPHLKYPLAPFNLLDKVAARRNVDRFVALSQGNADDIQAYLGIEQDRITEIPNGVDTEFYRPVDTAELEEKYNLKENVVVAVSRLVEYKGHGVLVEAVNGMEDTSLVIAGDGPYRDELEQKADEDVHFAGFVDEEELPSYYSLGDVFALPTFGEGMPLSILEAFACGTPVVSTRVGAIPDVVDEDVGRLVAPRDLDALQAALEDLFSDTERLEELGEECRRRAEDEYSWDSVVEKTLDMYRNII